MLSFNYLEPLTLNEALGFLDAYRQNLKVMAGGTDVVAAFNAQRLKTSYLMWLGRLNELKYKVIKDGMVRVGPLVRQVDLESSRDLPVCISQAASFMGTPQTRNLGTIGGNLVWASPAADLAPPLLALGATVKLQQIGREREVPLKDFFAGPNKTVLGDNELIAGISFNKLPENAGTAFIKLQKRKANSIAIVSTAVCVEVDGKNSCKDVRIALGAVAATPVRAFKAELFLNGKEFNDDSIAEAGRIAAQEINPITDGRAPGSYRRQVAGVLVNRAIRQALEEIKARRESA